MTQVLERCLTAVVLVAVTIALTACKSVPNSSPPPINVPPSLAANDVELAILIAIADPPEPPKLSPGQQITDKILDAIVGSYDSLSNPDQPWYFEDREPGAIFAGFQEDEFYIRVRVAFDTENVSLAIVESRNLDQTETRIHRGAFVRLQTLEGRIRRGLGKVAHRNIYGTGGN
jgi:hypothetical protein